jgi:hypothetical protein
VNVAIESTVWNCTDLGVDGLDACLPTSPRIRSLSRNARRWQYAVALKAKIPLALRFYRHDHNANSTPLRLP